MKGISIRLFSLHISDGRGWVRVFGFGLSWKDLRKHGLLFSERYGYKWHIALGGWSFSFLSGNKKALLKVLEVLVALYFIVALVGQLASR